MYISYKDVENKCNELHASAKRIKEIIESVENIKNNLSSSWQGIASEYYIKNLDDLIFYYTYLLRELESSIVFMAECAEGYQSIDQQVINEICSNLNISESFLPEYSKETIWGSK